MVNKVVCLGLIVLMAMFLVHLFCQPVASAACSAVNCNLAELIAETKMVAMVFAFFGGFGKTKARRNIAC